MTAGPPKTFAQKKLQTIARTHGLSVASVTGLAPLETSVKPLNDWQQAGFAGEMAYMLRPAELLSAPQKLFPEGRSIVSFAALYERSAAPQRPPGYGRVARYAWGNDYHVVLKDRLLALTAAIENEIGRKINYRIFSDAVPLLERALAERAGVGFVGKNSLLIRPGTGSFFFLAEILWDVLIEPDPLSIVGGTCASCVRCIEHCPTSAIVADRVVDARRCISYLSIEKRSAFDSWERRALGEWIFGCDVCQEVCPFNHASLKQLGAPEIAEFQRAQGVGALLNLSEVLAIRSSEVFRQRFAKTPLLRAKRGGLLRNAACVAANTLAEECVPVLIETARGDSDALIRQHAVWALGELREKGAAVPNIEMIFERAAKDNDAAVRNEATTLLGNHGAI